MFISALAETNRPPFDLPESESELVAGYQVEYSSTAYLLFMIGEYVNIVLMCAMMTVLFLGGWLPPLDVAPLNWIPGAIWFVLKVSFVFFLMAMVKAMVPERVCKIIDDAMQIHGATGISQWTPLADMYINQRTLRFADGPDEVHHHVVARAELAKAISG